jgi:hypothetical protein
MAALTLIISVAAAAVWFLYKGRPTLQTLGLPPCASPPDYELVSVPCTNPDLSRFSSLPMIQYCDLIRDSSRYENQIIRVKGIYSVSMENSSLDDPSCGGQNAFTWVVSEPYSSFEAALSAAKVWRDDRAEVVLLGKFYGPTHEGYGHLNGYRYKLSVMKVEEMKRLPANAP